MNSVTNIIGNSIEIQTTNLFFVDQLEDKITYWDTNQICKYANFAYLNSLNKSKIEIINKTSLKEHLGVNYDQSVPLINNLFNGEYVKNNKETVSIKYPNQRHPTCYILDIDKYNGDIKGFFVKEKTEHKIHEKEILSFHEEKFYKYIWDNSPFPIVNINLKGNIIYINKAAEDLFGYTSIEILKKDSDLLFEVFPTQQSNRFIQNRTINLLGKNKDTSKIPIEVSFSTLEIDSNVVISIYIKENTSQATLLNKVYELETLLDDASDVIITMSPEGKILTWNKSAEKTFGYDRAEIIGKKISVLYPDNSYQEESELINKIITGDLIHQYETVRVKKNGEKIIVSLSLSAIKDSNNKVVALSKILRDITKQKQLESDLILVSERYKLFIEQAPNAIAMFDNDLKYLAVSQKWLADYNLNGIEIMGKSHYEVFPEIGENWKSQHQKCLKGEIIQNEGELFIRKNGIKQWLKWEIRPWYVTDKKIGGIIMLTEDISVFKNQQGDQLRLLDILQKCGRIAKIASWEKDEITGTSTWDDKACQIFELPLGYTPSPQEIKKYYKKGSNYDRLRVASKKCLENGEPYDLEIEIETANGNCKWIRIIGEAEFIAGRCIKRYGIFQDITQKKTYEHEIQKSNEELNAIFNSSSVAIISCNESGIITHFNTGAEKMFLYTGNETIGAFTPLLFHDESEISRRAAELSKMFGYPVFGFDTLISMAKRGIYESKEWTYLRKDGSSFIGKLSVTTIKDKFGSPTGYLAVITDISDIKKAQNELKSVLDLTKSQNERLKNFAHIVSHNLRSHSCNMDMMLDMFIDENKELSSNELIMHLKKSCTVLKSNIDNLNEIVQINTASNQPFIPINLKSAIDSTLSNIYQLAKQEKMDILVNENTRTQILGIPAYVESILLNIVSNAIKYCSKERKPELNIWCTEEDQYVILHLKDNGLGIDLKKHGSKIFGMYKTFHGNENSRGVGLFITKNQIEAMEGKIEVSSEVNIGTTFKIYFKNE